jgi:hypothetical protein
MLKNQEMPCVRQGWSEWTNQRRLYSYPVFFLNCELHTLIHTFPFEIKLLNSVLSSRRGKCQWGMESRIRSHPSILPTALLLDCLLAGINHRMSDFISCLSHYFSSIDKVDQNLLFCRLWSTGLLALSPHRLATNYNGGQRRSVGISLAPRFWRDKLSRGFLFSTVLTWLLASFCARLKTNRV